MIANLSRLLFVCFLLCFAPILQADDAYQLSPSGNFVVSQDRQGDVWLFAATSPDRKLLFHSNPDQTAFQWSLDSRNLVVTRHGRIAIYEIPSGKLRSTQTASTAFSLPQISPDGRYLCAIRNHNLWLDSKPLTDTPSPNILSGDPDPVFAHEFAIDTHYWWSPDSSSIAYLETKFQTANHYPKPGSPLPTFRLKLIQIHSGISQTIAESSDEWPYILRVAFHPDSRRIAFYRLNRLQTQAELCLAENGIIRTVLTEKDDYWVNAPATPVFLVDGKRLAITSERSGHRHVDLYSLDGALIRDLTPPDLEVSQLLPTSQNALFITGSTGTHQEQHLFRLNLETGESTQLTTETGWHNVTLNASGTTFLDTYSSSVKPPATSWHMPNSAPRQISEPSPTETPIANDYLPIKTHDDVLLPARLFKPDNFDPHKRHPVIVYTFSGPAGHVVSDSWGGWQMAWNRSMVRKGYLVLAVDVRGSGGYSHLFEEYIHYRFGAQETVDLREVVAYLRAQPFVDPQRIGIWGCDYGAHIVVHAMLEFPHGFKAGFADSPITDWHEYNAYFTERYLGLPTKRASEYNDSSALENAKRLTGDLLVAAHPDNPIILSSHLDSLQKSFAEVKHPEITKHFHVFTPKEVNYRANSTTLAPLLAAMTDFFDHTL